jgi:hypothetical protein
MSGRQAPSHRNFHGRLQSSGVNAVPLGARRSTRLRGLPTTTTSPGLESRHTNDAVASTSVPTYDVDDEASLPSMQISQLHNDVADTTRPSGQSLVSSAQDSQVHVGVADTTPSAFGPNQATYEPREKREREPEPCSTPNKRVKTENESDASSHDQCQFPISDFVDASGDKAANVASENTRSSADERLSSPLSENAAAGASQLHESLHDQSYHSQSDQVDPSSQLWLCGEGAGSWYSTMAMQCLSGKGWRFNIFT